MYVCVFQGPGQPTPNASSTQQPPPQRNFLSSLTRSGQIPRDVMAVYAKGDDLTTPPVPPTDLPPSTFIVDMRPNRTQQQQDRSGLPKV